MQLSVPSSKCIYEFVSSNFCNIRSHDFCGVCSYRLIFGTIYRIKFVRRGGAGWGGELVLVGGSQVPPLL